MKNNELEKSLTHELVETVDYIPGSVVMKAILKKKTGTVTISSFDMGEALHSKISPFDNLIQIIDGEAEIIINEKSNTIETGQVIIIPAHARNVVKANKRFKMLSTIIKSGYEDISI
ncbi:cupin domain-containing protein [Aquimarina sp. RZ0]|uniref:cupin domain-containing protein n=1 Tax=Aquimarina sp. RZ0 TaxID=2607730 RepID=UPI0011F37E06|nr:cupin domain-containing protein [Aquimarina sp. RZ0]KAA1241543.1 cupin [Aquimarina sp. RZ0]